MEDYIKQLEVTVEDLQTKLANGISLTWRQSPKNKNLFLLMTGAETWIAKAKYSKMRAVSMRWCGQLACNFSYSYFWGATKEEVFKQIEEKLRT